MLNEIINAFKPKPKIEWRSILIIAIIGLFISHTESLWILQRLRKDNF